MMDIKEDIAGIVDALSGELLALSHAIHAHPEMAFEERQAVKLQKELLEQHGFEFESNFCGLETAYKAIFKFGKKGERVPTIAFIAEYDALKGIGHACGHNVIAASAIGAGIALSQSPGVEADILVIGTPAEESGGGKVLLVEMGAFDDVDFALMIHPEFRNIIGRGGIAATHLRVEFSGRPSHAVEPHKGINALIPLIEFFNGLNALRKSWPQGYIITGIITDGGQAPNVIPGHSEAIFVPRAPTVEGLKEMLADLERLAYACASITGASARMEVSAIYAERNPNMTMGRRFMENMKRLGVTMMLADETVVHGSSDIGNVSMVIPTIHEYLAIDDEAATHSEAFKEAAISPRGDGVVLSGAKGMAMTAWDLADDAAFREEVLEEFRRTTTGGKV